VKSRWLRTNLSTVCLLLHFPSKKEAKVRESIMAQAGRAWLEVIQDHAGNVIIRKPAHIGREQAPMALLQAHLDMVCEKDESTTHDFNVDPIKVTA
jgi:dipeptidase D